MKNIGVQESITDLGATQKASYVQHNKNPRVQALFGEKRTVGDKERTVVAKNGRPETKKQTVGNKKRTVGQQNKTSW